MQLRLAVGLATVLIMSTGCGSRDNSADTQTAAPAATASTQPAASGTESSPPAQSAIWFDPAGLSACARPEKVTVNWDATDFQGIKAVEIVAVNAAGKETVFVSAGRKGSKETGPWMRAGGVMILRNKADGAELAKATVAAIACG